MLARREIRRLESWRKDGGETTPIGMAVTAWEHVIRMCEGAGIRQSGVLREAPIDDTQEPDRFAEWHAPSQRLTVAADLEALREASSSVLTNADRELLSLAAALLRRRPARGKRGGRDTREARGVMP
jgi:hypothetical protein